MRVALILIASLLLALPAQAQFLQFSVYIDSEVSAATIQELDFGSMLQNSEALVGLDENGSGWFQVAVLNVSDVQLFLDAPDQLELETEGIMCGEDLCGIDMELGFAYYISETPRLEGGRPMQPLSKGFNAVRVNEPGQLTGEPEYIYININVFGKLTVGDVPGGNYTGTLNLEVTY
ncbi:MAG: hypothetical protein HLUCCA01_06885 [Bacteroidetes bacterium HLUCCA01]|nr:MAG: hypothetical protein HLUCCA01_06885 [Bacteroidetes bacterium HLUCCA01]